MSAAQQPRGGAASGAAQGSFLELFEQVSEAVESGAGLPSVTRAASRALDASAIVLDSSSSVLAVACASPDDERAVMAGEGASHRVELRVAGSAVGELRFRTRGEVPEPALLRMVATLIALEVDRSTAPERASEAAVRDFLEDLVSRRLTDRENIVARAEELGCGLGGGASVIVARARPHAPEEGDWRARVLTVAERGARAVERTTLAALVRLGPLRVGGDDRDLVLLVPSPDGETAARAGASVLNELRAALDGFALTVALSRRTIEPADLHRGASEAILAANVAEARGVESLSFEETGAYRLLLPVMNEDPRELRRFHEETVAPLAAYDDQYETDLVKTLETFLDADGNVARTAEKLFTHRHTVRYRLDRVRELSGLDVGSTDGRERLSLGLKAMRVLGIAPPGGPAHEPGAEGGLVPRAAKDR
ncbi:MAG: helix-turn-helix domain-containing protein [Actinomycetota bacterium]|nr:helix-turn-helix domain-containing protein [Actinomycetota bacterium]MDQ3647236.1 helix-turn-helix domain-containing protein [Actinomycetota bacterium]